MGELRRQTGMRVACGQNEAQSYRFRDMLVAGAVDIVQPNVVITGGFTQCQKIAALASGLLPVAAKDAPGARTPLCAAGK